MNTSPTSYSLYPTKYLGLLSRPMGHVHVFIPLHESGEYIEAYDSFNECVVVYLASLDELNGYIITEFDFTWFDEHVNYVKSHYSIKNRQPNIVLNLNQVIPSRDSLTRWDNFESLMSQPNDPLRPIVVQEISAGLFQVVDGNHRLEYSKAKGYTQIPAIIQG